jgi:SAM-dependent methyltransferase
VNAAYRAILRRPPDSGGSVHYLGKLRNGCAKVDILGRLRYSREGRAVGVKISGLVVPFLLQQVYRIPVFGRFVQILSAIWQLPHLERNQRAFENHTILLIEQTIRQLQDFAVPRQKQAAINDAHDAVLSGIQKSVDDLQNAKANHDDLKRGIETVQRSLQDAVSSLQSAKANRDDLKGGIESIQRSLQDAAKASQSALDDAIHSVNAQTLDIKRNLLDQDRRLGLLLEEARKRLPEPISSEQIGIMLTEDDHRMDAMYASFEDRFRGTREDIKQRQSIYLPIVHAAKAGTKDAPILDLGSGRGEWLEFLRDEGLIARGIDINRVFLEDCRELSLDVVEQDALVYLRSLKSRSIGAVTSFHLIEHLPLKTLIMLMDETLRVLQPGGLAILETPNPANVQVGSCNFYFDPTHRNPLPGPLTQYLLEARGFSRTLFMPLHPYGETSDRLTSGEPQMQRVFNQFFFGPQDYAILAYKAES